MRWNESVSSWSIKQRHILRMRSIVIGAAPSHSSNDVRTVCNLSKALAVTRLACCMHSYLLINVIIHYAWIHFMETRFIGGRNNINYKSNGQAQEGQFFLLNWLCENAVSTAVSNCISNYMPKFVAHFTNHFELEIRTCAWFLDRYCFSADSTADGRWQTDHVYSIVIYY